MVVEVTDRGPYTGGRDIDLSALAAEELGLTYIGVDYVDVQVLNQGPSPNYWRDTRAGAARRPRPFPFAGVSKQIAEVLTRRLEQATG